MFGIGGEFFIFCCFIMCGLVRENLIVILLYKFMIELKGLGQLCSVLLLVGILLFNYCIVKKLVSGGFSFVYFVIDEYGMLVVVKEYLLFLLVCCVLGELIFVVFEESGSVFCFGLKYFFEEGWLLVKIFYFVIVCVFNFFWENGIVYMVMMYEQGKMLQEYIFIVCQQGKLKMLCECFIWQVFYDLMSGLCEVYIYKLLYFDIKFGNIYLCEDFLLILFDFGVVRQMFIVEVLCFQLMYMLGFVVLELYCKYNELGLWMDIYSIGVIIYVCMVGMLFQEVMQCEKDDKLEEGLECLCKVYMVSLIDLVGWCLKMKLEECLQSVFCL